MKERTQRKEDKSTGWRGSPAKSGRATVEHPQRNRFPRWHSSPSCALSAKIETEAQRITGDWGKRIIEDAAPERSEVADLLSAGPSQVFESIFARIMNRSIIAIAASSAFLWTPIASAQDAAAGGANVSLLQAFFIQRNPRSGEIEILGSLIVWLLLAMSVASIALIGVFLRENRREAVIPPHLVKEVRALAKGGNKEAVLRFSSEENSYLAKVLRSTLAESEFGRAAMLRALERSSEEYTAERLRRVETLNIFGSVAPMIGLFGTVYGMILAFSEIVASGGSPDPVGLAAGIGTALTTTFWGLVVAIPALSGYAFIRNGVDALTSEASLLVDDLVNHMRSGRE